MHQEARIERNGAVRAIDEHRVGVTAETPLLFEEVHPVPAAQREAAAKPEMPAPMTAMFFMRRQE